PPGAMAIAAGTVRALALKADGTVSSWGLNDFGQLGNGTTTNSNVPVAVSGLTGVTAIAAGDGHSVAMKPDGTVYTWGYNGAGQLGIGSNANSSVPVQVPGLTNVLAVAGDSTSQHTLAITSARTLISISVTPGAVLALTGASRQFSATGTYSDFTTQDLTAAASWSSSDTTV